MPIQTLIIITFFLVAGIIIAIVLIMMQKKKVKKYKTEIERLEREKNLIVSTPILSELAKLETIIKNEKMEEKYRIWQQKFESIKEIRITKINDMLIDLDIYREKKDYKSYRYYVAKTELELYKAKESTDHLLDEIKEITLSEEKYRNIVTKLKNKYRELNSEYQNHKDEYQDIQEIIELQFENIEKRFMDFEVVMENNEYNEVIHIVKALDTMIDHMTIVVDEVPNLLLLANQLIPKRMEQIDETYQEMITKEYPLGYLNIEYNLEETKKNVKTIVDRIRVLNLEECMFELKTILDYLDSLFTDFEKERLSRKVYDEIEKEFRTKLKKTNKVVKDIYNQIDDIKNMYDLTDKDVKIIDDVNETLAKINEDYKTVLKNVKEKESPYSKSHKEIESLTTRLKSLEEELDRSLKSLGSMYDDEMRAREQLDEIQDLLKQCKIKMRGYKLPIITDIYFVQLSEANEAILEIIKELEKKPIVIKILNTRVDTARDLVLKLYHTTNEMIKTAQLAEMAIVYGNRYRDSSKKEIELGLNQAEILFFKGNYKGALETSIKTIELVEEGIYQKLLGVYEK